MKVAIVHDWLGSKYGGAEKVFVALAQMYPKADLFALTNDNVLIRQDLGRPVQASRLRFLPKFIRSRPKYCLPFVRGAVQAWDFSGYDLVITSSTAWVKNIQVPKGTKHVCYCHSPARFMWDSWPGYLDSMQLGPVRRFYVTWLISRLRLWDFYGSDSVTEFVSNSHYIAGRIKKYYHRDSTVVYPPIPIGECKSAKAKDDYYLVLSVLSRYKQIDLAIQAFRQSGKRLVIAGDGPDRMRLEKLASGVGSIEFLGRVSDERKYDLLARAKALIFPSIEDFGITPVEAMASGTSVIARSGGGLSETVIDGKTGIFFDESAAASLNRGIDRFESSKFSQADLTQQAKKFDKKHFEEGIRKVVKQHV